MSLKITVDQVKEAQKLILRFQAIHGQLIDLGLPRTAAAMGLVLDKIGWEIADRMEQSGLVGPEEHKRRERHAVFIAHTA